jgi:hypothetical protein
LLIAHAANAAAFFFLRQPSKPNASRPVAAKCGWRRADLRPDYSKQQTALYGGGWMMPPGSFSIDSC